MKTAQNNSKLSIALVFGMVCASVLMMTGSASGARHHAVQASFANTVQPAMMVTELQPVVITGKRLSAEEKAQYRRELAGTPAPQA